MLSKINSIESFTQKYPQSVLVKPQNIPKNNAIKILNINVIFLFSGFIPNKYILYKIRYIRLV